MKTKVNIEVIAARFGPRLKALREERGLTQRGFALTLGTSPATLHAYENQKKFPTWPVALRIAAALGVPVGAFAE